MLRVFGPHQILTVTLLALAPLVPVIAQETPEKWTVVYLGDTWGEVARMYGAGIEGDFGVDVFYTQRNAGSAALAANSLRNGMWNVVQDAQVVVVSIGEADDDPGFCRPQTGDLPFARRLDDLPGMIDDFLVALTELADPEKTIIRVANEPVYPSMMRRAAERGVEAECIDAVQQINAIWLSAAEKHGVTVVDFFGAWNGPDGTVETPSEYIAPDGTNLSSEGAKAAAGLLLSVGYQPFEP